MKEKDEHGKQVGKAGILGRGSGVEGGLLCGSEGSALVVQRERRVSGKGTADEPEMRVRPRPRSWRAREGFGLR